ncbi:MAG TPA: AsmA-like C-terminal domain-containing protein [Candidatus Binatia bacterium]
MRKWLIAGSILLILIVLGVVGLLNINALIARNKDYLIGQAEAALGRKVSVDKVEATLFSGIGARLTNFTMADDPAYASGDFVRAKDLQVIVKFWPLLRKSVQVKRVILHDPVIQIVRNRDGNFNFSTIGKKAKEKKEDERHKEERAPREREPALLISLVDISNGNIRYLDKKTGTDTQAKQIDLKIEDFDFAKPFSVKLKAAIFADKQNFALASRVGPLGQHVEPKEVPVDGEIDIDPLNMTQLRAALPIIKSALPRDFDISGVYRVKDLKFKGTLNNLALDGRLEGTNGALRYGNAFQKPAGDPLALNLDVRFAGNKLTIRSGNLKVHSLELAAAGDVQMGDTSVLNLSLDSKPASLEGWDRIIPALANYQLSGTMDMKATVRGRMGKGAAPQVEGTLGLKKVSAKPPTFPRPIQNLDTTIRFTGQKADIGDMTLTLGKSRIRLAAAIEKFAPLTLTYKMSTPELWPADYSAALPEERKSDVIRNLQSAGQFSMASGDMVYQGKVSSADGTLYNVPYKALDATLSLADKVANVRSLRVNALSGALQLDGQYSFKEAVPQFSMASKVQNIDVKELYTLLDAKAERDIRGRMNADMKLTGSGKSWETIKPTLQGQGDAEVVQGALLNFNIADNVLTGITGIPGLTNAINPSLKAKYPETFTAKDTEFKELKANFDLADGRMNVKNMRMAAAEFVVQGTGWADFERKVDFRATLTFSQRLSADLSQSAREMKYLLNNQGQLEVPFALTGRMPNVRPKPDTRYLGQMVQRGFLRKGTEELQNRFLGGGKDSSAPNEQAPGDTNKKKKTSTEDMIRRGLEGLFKR